MKNKSRCFTRRRSQIKMGETIAILVIFFFLLIFGMSFYMNFFMRDVRNKAHDFTQLEAIEIIQKAVYLPELQCSDMEVQITSCYDLLKVMSFKAIIEASPFIKLEYYPILGYSSLSLKPIYPDGIPILIYNNTFSENEYGDKTVVNIPISIFNATSDTYSLGVLELIYTSKK
jgi:hypothetical protein